MLNNHCLSETASKNAILKYFFNLTVYLRMTYIYTIPKICKLNILMAYLSVSLNSGIVLEPIEKETFSRARDLGIRRTAHAGEAGPAQSVIQALDELHAERIGHGYHSVDDAKVYRRVLEDGVHLEACPTSSLVTGAVGLDRAYTGEGHPIVRWGQLTMLTLSLTKKMLLM